MNDKLKLYEVTVTIHMYVMAEDENEAEFIGKQNMREESAIDIEAMMMKPEYPVWQGWHKATPYGEQEDDKTVRQIMDEMKTAERSLPRSHSRITDW